MRSTALVLAAIFGAQALVIGPHYRFVVPSCISIFHIFITIRYQWNKNIPPPVLPLPPQSLPTQSCYENYPDIFDLDNKPIRCEMHKYSVLSKITKKKAKNNVLYFKV